MENQEILIFESLFLSLACLKEVRQDTSHSIRFFLTIINWEMILRELLGPADLAKDKAFYIHKSTEIIIISEDKNLVFIVFQVVTPSLKSLNNSLELLIMRFVPRFCKDHFSRKKGYWLPLANFGLKEIRMIFIGYMIGKKLIQSHLTENFTHGIPQSIGLNQNITLWIKIPKN